MNAQHAQSRHWRVVVQCPRRIGDIGCVVGPTEGLARCAALSKFGESGKRDRRDDPNAIYEDDDFDVRPA